MLTTRCARNRAVYTCPYYSATSASCQTTWTVPDPSSPVRRASCASFEGHDGDIGSGVTQQLALDRPASLVGIHLTPMWHWTYTSFCRSFVLCRMWDSNPHKVALTRF